MIIIASKGVITGITWDDGCLVCADNGPNCIYNAVDVNTSSVYRGDTGLRGCYEDIVDCALPTPVTNSSASGGANSTANFTSSPCDLKIFVTWTGTDRNGAFFTSAGQRLSRYEAFGITSLYQGVLNGVSAGTAILNTALNGAQAIPGAIFNNGRRLGDAAGGGDQRLAAAEAAGLFGPVSETGPGGAD